MIVEVLHHKNKKSDKCEKNILIDNKGFSKIQNVMILCIVIVLVTVGGYAFYGYIRSSYQVKAVNTARKLYEGAEDYLYELKREGKLEDFNLKASYFGGPVSMDKQKEILRSIYEGKDFDSFFSEYEEYYQDIPIRYIVLESKDIKSDDREENPVLEMIEYTILDEKIKGHTFLIEYNGNSGAVTAALYSEKTDCFTYESDVKSKDNALLRDLKSLKGKWQGYYGINAEELLGLGGL